MKNNSFLGQIPLQKISMSLARKGVFSPTLEEATFVQWTEGLMYQPKYRVNQNVREHEIKRLDEKSHQTLMKNNSLLTTTKNLAINLTLRINYVEL